MISSFITSTNLPIAGSICGDILGSGYEWHSTKDLNHHLCRPDDRFTDDSVCTIAVTDAIINQYSMGDSLRKWCRRYYNAGYGPSFRRWIIIENGKPYNSWGNGSAMRASATGALAQSLNEALRLAEDSALPTHNHPEGVKGAKATAVAIYLAQNGATKTEIKQYIEQNFGYNLNRQYSDIQPSYSFDVSCQGSVPESIICFLESTNYETAVRRAIAMGGDADTMACICGGIAAAFYGEIPESILNHCLDRIPSDMKEVLAKSAAYHQKKFSTTYLNTHS